MNIIRRSEVGTVTLCLISSAGGHYMTSVDERAQDFTGIVFLARDWSQAERRFSRVVQNERIKLEQDAEMMA